MIQTLPQQQQKRAFGTELTNIENKSTPNGMINNNANNGKNQQEILKKMQKSRSQLLNNVEKISESNKTPLNLKKEVFQNLDLNSIDRELTIIDQQYKNIPESVSAYTKQIFTYLRQQDDVHSIKGEGVKQQREINEQMRGILIDWLVDLHLSFRMIPETLYMTVLLIDKYLEKNQVQRNKLQLVGVTCLFIAAKYEEIYPPHIRDFVKSMDKTYQKYDILEMEGKILLSLGFNLTFPSSFRFLNRFTKIIKADNKSIMLSRYLTELALLDYNYTKYPQALLAGAAIYLTCKIYNKSECWNQCLQFTAQYTEKDIRVCAKDLCNTLTQANQSKLQSVRRKFSSEKYLSISKIQLEKNN